jgi:hypothetical protein
MTTAAWIMMLATWSVVIFFAAYFFWRVLTTPGEKPKDRSGPT